MIARMRSAFSKNGIFSDINVSPRFVRYLSILSKLLLLLIASGCMLSLSACRENIGLLNPKGLIAYEERKLFFDTLALMLIVVLPVIIMSFTFVYHYQASHRIKDYKPNWSHSYFLESLWWGIPCAIIVVLAVLTWKSTHELDPYRKIAVHNQAPLVVQVIALPWKWLFIYPQQNIATINYLVVPVGHEVEYWITSDNVPMSAFFIPQLGSQIYAMAGMRTRLHLLANEVGTYDGMNTQFNGDGFSEMHFPVYVVNEKTMQTWINHIKKSSPALNNARYKQLLNPSIANNAEFYSGVEKNLFNQVLDIYQQSSGQVHPRSEENKLNPSLNEGH